MTHPERIVIDTAVRLATDSSDPGRFAVLLVDLQDAVATFLRWRRRPEAQGFVEVPEEALRAVVTYLGTRYRPGGSEAAQRAAAMRALPVLRLALARKKSRPRP